MADAIWVSYDLGVSGDYTGMYTWLDTHDAKECGDSVAYLRYEHPTADLIKDITKDLKAHVQIDPKKDRIYVVRLADGKIRGRFIFGRRRNSPWAGTAAKGEQGEDTA